MRFFWFFLLLLSCSIGVCATVARPARTAETAHLTRLKLDSSRVTTRKFNQKAIHVYSKQKEFIYDDVSPKGLSWWDRFWRKVWYILDKIFSGGGESATGFNKMFFVFLKWLLIVLLVGAVGFIIVKILGLDLKVLTGRSKAIEVPYEESLENIHQINFDEQIENAVKNSNYRSAVRLLYLKTLKTLTDRGLINWQVEKTNQTYINEIEDLQLQQQFASLTQQFEYIWYGEFFIDKDTFEFVNQSFVEFNEKTK